MAVEYENQNFFQWLFNLTPKKKIVVKTKESKKLKNLKTIKGPNTKAYTTTLAGTKYGDCQFVIKNLIKVGDELVLLPDPGNKYDDTAVRVVKFKKNKSVGEVGWIPGKDEKIYNLLMEGIKLKAIVSEVREPNEEWNFYNVVITITNIDGSNI